MMGSEDANALLQDEGSFISRESGRDTNLEAYARDHRSVIVEMYNVGLYSDFRE